MSLHNDRRHYFLLLSPIIDQNAIYLRKFQVRGSIAVSCSFMFESVLSLEPWVSCTRASRLTAQPPSFTVKLVQFVLMIIRHSRGQIVNVLKVGVEPWTLKCNNNNYNKFHLHTCIIATTPRNEYVCSSLLSSKQQQQTFKRTNCKRWESNHGP